MDRELTPRDQDLDATRVERPVDPPPASGPRPVEEHLERLEAGGGFDVLLVGLALDSSYSIHKHGNTEAVRQGHNEFMLRFREGTTAAVQAYVRDLNGKEYSRFASPRGIRPLTRWNYRPAGRTRLFDGTLETLLELRGRILALEETGRSARVVCAVMTDGKDTESRRSASEVEAMVEDLRRTARWLFLGMGVGGEVDFHAVFASMGIPREFVVTCARRDEEIRDSFDALGRITVVASRSQADFARSTIHGFSALPREPRPGKSPPRE